MSKDNAQRSFVVYKIQIHKRRKPDEICDLDTIHNIGIKALFVNFISETRGVVRIGNSSKYLCFNPAKTTKEGVLASYLSGVSGEEITMVNPDSGKILETFSSGNAPMPQSRVYMKAGYSPKYALVCIEHVQGSAGDTALFAPFRGYIASSDSDCVLKWEAVTEAEAVNNFIGVESIEVKRYLKMRDCADSAVSEARCITTTLSHRRGRRFSLAPFRAALADRSKAVSLFGLMPVEESMEYEKTEVYFRLRGKDGKTHRFFLDNHFDVKVREVLNEKGEPPLSDEDFLDRCDSRCEGIQDKLGRAL